MATSNSFIENVNALANATALASGNIVSDTQAARDAAVAAAAEADADAQEASASELLAQEWSEKGHNIPITGTESDPKYSAVHWATEASIFSVDKIIDDNITSTKYTWSSSLIDSKLVLKSDSTHLHTNIYEPVISPKNSAFNKSFAASTGEGGSANTIARSDHTHNIYEPIRTVEGTAYNKDFGSTAGTVLEGDTRFDLDYMPLINTNTAYNRSFVVDLNAPKADEVSRGNHLHTASAIQYDNTNSSLKSTSSQGAIDELDDLVGGGITTSEKAKLNAGMTGASQLVNIITTGVPVVIDTAMTVGSGSKNTVYSTGIKINYPVAPDKFVEGNFSATVSVAAEANTTYKLHTMINGVAAAAYNVEIGSPTNAAGTYSATLTGFISGLDNLDTVAIGISNETNSNDATVNSVNVSFAGEPEGAVVSSGQSVTHADILGRDAALQHPTSSIYLTGNTGIDLDAVLDEKADKISSPVTDNILVMDATGNLKDSGQSVSTISNGMDLVSSPTLDNIVTMTSGGNSADGGLKLSALALVGGNALNRFKVANSQADDEAVSQSQMNLIATDYTTEVDFDAHVALPNPHSTSYTDVGAAPTVHTHVVNDVTGLQDDLNAKYNKVSGQRSGYIPIFKSDGQLEDGIDPDTLGGVGLHDQLKSYVIGSIVTYVDATLPVPMDTEVREYICTVATTGSWNSANWNDPLKGDIVSWT